MANFHRNYIKHYLNFDPKTIWSDWLEQPEPDYFSPNGSQIIFGYQGEGKTYLAVYILLFQLKPRYPKTILVSNVEFTDMIPVQLPEEINSETDFKAFWDPFDATRHYIRYEHYNDLMRCLKHVRNGIYGVTFLIDEIHQYFNSHDSKSVPAWVTRVFSQQRKQHILIVGTAQVKENVIKAIRDQVDNYIFVSKMLGYFIKVDAFDPRKTKLQYGEELMFKRKGGWVFINEKTRNSYDTEQLIESGREIFGAQELAVNVSTVEQQKARRMNKSGRYRRTP